MDRVVSTTRAVEDVEAGALHRFPPLQPGYRTVTPADLRLGLTDSGIQPVFVSREVAFRSDWLRLCCVNEAGRLRFRMISGNGVPLRTFSLGDARRNFDSCHDRRGCSVRGSRGGAMWDGTGLYDIRGWAKCYRQPATLRTSACAARRKPSAKSASPTFLASTMPPTHSATSASARSCDCGSSR